MHVRDSAHQSRARLKMIPFWSSQILLTASATADHKGGPSHDFAPHGPRFASGAPRKDDATAKFDDMEEQAEAPHSPQTSATDLAACVQHRNDVLVASLVGRVTGSPPATVRDEHFRSSSQQHL